MNWTLPNVLTAIRIVAIAPLTIFILLDTAFFSWAALAVYTIAALTDNLDGRIARARGQETPLGACADVIADKLLVCGTLLLLATMDRLGLAGVLAALIILMRELSISGLREYLAPLNVKITSSKLGKWKTGFQMTALGFLMMGAHAPESIPSRFIGHICLIIAAVMTAKSAYHYFKQAIPHLRQAK